MRGGGFNQERVWAGKERGEFATLSAVTPLMALKLGRLLLASPEMWLSLQQAYDLAVVRSERGDEIEGVEGLAV